MGHFIEEAAPIPEDVWERLPGDETPESTEAWRRVYLMHGASVESDPNTVMIRDGIMNPCACGGKGWHWKGCEHAQAFLNGYRSIGPLEPAQTDGIGDLIAGAAKAYRDATGPRIGDA